MTLPNSNYQLPIPLEALSLKMKRGFSPMVCIVGDETGIGKSRLGLRCSELIYWRTFNKKWEMNKHVFFSMTKFKDKLFNSEGKIFIIEEAEMELGSDDWQSISNRWFSRIKDTQRIKGNLYIIILPLFMALARKHRRRINYIVDVKARGYANFWKIKRNSAQLLGDEISKTFIGSVILREPDCDSEFEILDRINKQRIEKEQGDLFDKEMHYRKLMQERKIQRLEKILGKETTKEKDKPYVYFCHACKFTFKSEHEIDEVIKCDNCGKKVYIDIQNLVSSNGITENLNDYKDEDEEDD